jgi:hypothetical protein
LFAFSFDVTFAIKWEEFMKLVIALLFSSVFWGSMARAQYGGPSGALELFVTSASITADLDKLTVEFKYCGDSEKAEIVIYNCGTDPNGVTTPNRYCLSPKFLFPETCDHIVQRRETFVFSKLVGVYGPTPGVSLIVFGSRETKATIQITK